MRTPEQAAELLCPFARTFAPPQAEKGCQGPSCALWRWEKITTSHPLWAPAVKARAAETDDKVPYAKSSKWVAENLAELGMVPTKGHCGAGGPV